METLIEIQNRAPEFAIARALILIILELRATLLLNIYALRYKLFRLRVATKIT